MTIAEDLGRKATTHKKNQSLQKVKALYNTGHFKNLKFESVYKIVNEL